MKQIEVGRDFKRWCFESEQLLKEKIHPLLVSWNESNLNLFAHASDAGLQVALSPLGDFKFNAFPQEFLKLAKSVSLACDESRWELLYNILYRLIYENKNLLKISTDPQVYKANRLAKSVGRDIHKMHAFVRFKEQKVGDDTIYLAWHQPEHYIAKAGGHFFKQRFGDKKWSIFTPEESVHWDLEKLYLGAGMAQADFKVEDAWEELWKSYYKSIFNSSRIKIKAMLNEMPRKYWSSMPETELITELVKHRPEVKKISAVDERTLPKAEVHSLNELNHEVTKCQACPLYRGACVKLEQPRPSLPNPVMVVSDYPRFYEVENEGSSQQRDLEFFNKLVDELKLDRENFYYTHLVKHAQSKTRDNQPILKPQELDYQACLHWLHQEIKLLKPRMIVALGTRPSTLLMGIKHNIKDIRGKIYQHTRSQTPLMTSWELHHIFDEHKVIVDLEKHQQVLQDLNQVSDTF